MKRQVFVFGIALIVLALSAGCGSTPPPATAAPSATADPTAGSVLFLERSGGLQGISESWAVYASGEVTSSHGGQTTLSPAVVRSALDQLKNVGFFEFEDEYGTSGTCNDCMTYRLTLNYAGTTKTVTTVYEATDTPAQVRDAIEIVNRLVSGIGEQ